MVVLILAAINWDAGIKTHTKNAAAQVLIVGFIVASRFIGKQFVSVLGIIFKIVEDMDIFIVFCYQYSKKIRQKITLIIL